MTKTDTWNWEKEFQEWMKSHDNFLHGIDSHMIGELKVFLLSQKAVWQKEERERIRKWQESWEDQIGADAWLALNKLLKYD